MQTSSVSSASPYHPLQEPDSIRLLKVFSAAQDEDDLQGELIVVRRSNKPEYRAFSYMWGPPNVNEQRPLKISGSIIALRSNIASALYTYRKHRRNGLIWRDIPLWIDLICINQSDVLEKNHQVQQMGKIYSEARDVLIWLGKETEEPLLKYYRGPVSSALIGFQVHESQKPKDGASVRRLFWALLNKHWSRTWILQEICLAKKVAIFTSSGIFEHDALQRFQTDRTFLHESIAKYWCGSENKSNPHAEAVRVVDRFLKIWTVRESRQDPRWKPLSLSSTVYQLANDSACYERRDKVFAFLGMTARGDEITVDYGRNEADIFWEVLHLSSMQELDEQEVDSLREALGLTWRSLLLHATRVNPSSALASLLLPCSLNCGVLSMKKGRSRQPKRSCRPSKFLVNSWLQIDSDTAEILVQVRFMQHDHNTYHVQEIRFCAVDDDTYLVGGTLVHPNVMQILDVSWNRRRETIAADIKLYCFLQYVAASTSHLEQDDEVKEAVFLDFDKIKDGFHKARKGHRESGIPLEQESED